MCRQSAALQEGVQVCSQQLRWSYGDKLGDAASLLAQHGTFDTIIAADCLFFKDFHDDLLWTLSRVLSIASSSTVYLLQPRRGNTTQLFLEKASEYFDSEVLDDYCTDITHHRQQYLATCSAKEYDEDIHYPILIILKHKSNLH